MPLSYPPAAPTISGDVESIHVLLKSPTLIARRLRTIAEQRFIADALLTGRFQVNGGAVNYQEQGDSIYTGRAPESVAPGGEYPLANAGIGPTQTASVEKWGEDVPLADESIKRLLMDPVNRAFLKVINQMVKTVDSIALAVIASRVSQTDAAAGVWSAATADAIFKDVMLPVAEIRDLGEGYDPDTVALSTTAWTYAMAAFVKAGYVPREAIATNPALTGEFPVIGGLRWLSTPHMPIANTAVIVDSTQLGGRAAEQLGGPGYTGAMAGVETKSIRDDDNDRYKLRGRRVTVPIVIEPGAGWVKTGLGA